MEMNNQPKPVVLQSLTVSNTVAPQVIQRDGYSATSQEELAAIKAEQARVAEEARKAEEAKQQAEAAKKQASSPKSYTPPAAGNPDPGSAKAYAQQAVAARGWGAENYNCLVSLWQKESGWNTFAMNKSSGAYGIPQSLPGSKMASAGADWQTNPNTQIEWGLGYISGRYGTPCGAWAHSQSHNWY